MIGRRSAALLCVLLAHALVIYLLLELRSSPPRERGNEEFVSEPITLLLPQLPESAGAAPVPDNRTLPPIPERTGTKGSAPAAAPSGSSTAPGYVDWPVEGKKSAARVLAREAEAERIAKMFAGPGGTWASLTKRQRSKLNKFRFKPGIDGLEYDAQGNQILHISEGCMIVNSSFIACTVGKAMVHDDMFENMREYFDEQRQPQTDEGNGTEPEALRPPY